MNLSHAIESQMKNYPSIVPSVEWTVDCEVSDATQSVMRRGGGAVTGIEEVLEELGRI
jgi:hypothetical protein